jgi:choloylglycine hydrolase
MEKHYAIIGMATISKQYPLYYDATNEFGLSMAGLNFPHSSVYHKEDRRKDNIAPFEVIPWILGSCKSVEEAEQKLKNANITDIPFSPEFPTSPLHWFLADFEQAITIESVAEGLKIYENPVGILTNEPPFPYQITNLCNYQNVTNEEIQNKFAPTVPLRAYSRGMGGLGLPGDLSSASRFVKATFTKMNSLSKDGESASISQVFHILGSVAQQQGCVKVGNLYEKTVYSSCCNTTKGIYYYTTYENSQITGIQLRSENLDSHELINFPLIQGQQIRMEN